MITCRGVAQPGSVLAWGARGRVFESHRPDQSISALHHNRGMCIYQTRLTTPFQPHKAKTLSR